MAIDAQSPLGQIVAERLARAEVLERYGIDYCCGGRTTLARACAEKGLEIAEVLNALTILESQTVAEDLTDDSSLSPSLLADRIVETHHVYVRQALPRLDTLFDKVVAAHGENHPELLAMRPVFRALKAELELHLLKEEQILFPLIKRLEAAATLPPIHCGTVDNPIFVMEHEHDSAGSALKRLRDLSGGFVAPADGCSTYRVLFHELAEFEADLHRHIHKENNILFPRASEMEAMLRERAQGSSERLAVR
jgi:regulator of cell morphogenesis and NO signaling